jgi:hypothetical protein
MIPRLQLMDFKSLTCSPESRSTHWYLRQSIIFTIVVVSTEYLINHEPVNLKTGGPYRPRFPKKRQRYVTHEASWEICTDEPRVPLDQTVCSTCRSFVMPNLCNLWLVSRQFVCHRCSEFRMSRRWAVGHARRLFTTSGSFTDEFRRSGLPVVSDEVAWCRGLGIHRLSRMSVVPLPRSSIRRLKRWTPRSRVLTNLRRDAWFRMAGTGRLTMLDDVLVRFGTADKVEESASEQKNCC